MMKFRKSVVFCRWFVGWPVGERLGTGWRGWQWRRKIDLLSVPFSFRNVFLRPDFEMFFNYLSSTNGQMVWDFPKMKQHFQRGLTIYNREDSTRDSF